MKKGSDQLKALSVLVPAHNEEAHIQECVEALVQANYPASKRIIIINDASKDSTKDIVNQLADEYSEVSVLHNEEQLGKADSLNRGLEIADTELVAVVDGDSVVDKNSLKYMAEDFFDHRIHGSTGTIFAINLQSIFHVFVNIQLLYSSLYRYLMAKINANITTPGPLSMYRRKTLNVIGGFCNDGFCEDTELAIRMQLQGYRITANRKSRTGTYLPISFRLLLRQQLRWFTGVFYLVRRKIRWNRLSIINLFALPLVVLGLANSLILSPVMIVNHVKSFGEIDYSALSSASSTMWVVVQEFFSLKVFGMIPLFYHNYSILPVRFMLPVVSTMVNVLLYFYAVLVFCRQWRWQNLLALCYLNLLWIFMFFIHFPSLRGLFVKSQHNLWTKSTTLSDGSLFYRFCQRFRFSFPLFKSRN